MTHSPAGCRIVVGIDGSAASDAAVRWAVREARLRHATVHLVSAYYSDRGLRAQYVPPSSWMTPEQDRRAAGVLLAAAVDIARRYLPTGRLMAEVANERPARALLDRSARAELLVLGTTRPRPQPGQPPQAMGPVARPCLRLAHCPVVVVSPEDRPAGGMTAGYPSRMRRAARRPGSAARQHRLAGRRVGARYSPADAPQPAIAAKDLSPGAVGDVRDRPRLDGGYVDVHPGHWL
jgi:nucleotide-binding universal stress UspA family protein